MEGPKLPEQHPVKSIVIEAPEFIPDQSNFYDQAPFDNVVNVTSKNTGLQVDLLREVLFQSVQATKHPLESNISVSQNHRGDSRVYLDIRQLSAEQLVDVSKIVYRKMHTSGNLPFVVVQSMLTVLNKYPYWMSYVDSQSRAYHNVFSGNPNRGNDSVLRQVPSYGAWATEKLSREGLLKTKGIENVFPQDLKEEALGDVIASGATKKWVLLNASEIIR